MTPSRGRAVNTIILSAAFFGCLFGIVVSVFKDRINLIKARFNLFKQTISDHLGWPILATGLGITLFFTLIYDELNLEGSEIVDYIRTAVLTIGAFGGAYGLVLAAKRQKVLEEQAKQGQDQLFNDSFGRGVEMLGHESMTTRIAGIKVLEDLALSSVKKDIVYKTIEKFLQTKAAIKRDEKGRPIPSNNTLSRPERQDVIASAEALIRIDQKSGAQTNFNILNLAHFIFQGTNLEKISLRIFNCNLKSMYLDNIQFTGKIDHSNLANSGIRFSNFKNSIISASG